MSRQLWIVALSMRTAERMMPPARKQMLERGKKTLETVLAKAGAKGLGALQTTTNEVNYLVGIARLAIESLEVPADTAEKELHAVH